MSLNSELYHHGILGMKWGQRNGPPYPLGASDHSASEKKAGWRKSLDKKESKSYSKNGDSKGLTDEQKRALKTGAIVVGSVLAVYGAHKLRESGLIDQYVDSGKQLVTGLGFGDKSNPITSAAEGKVDPKLGLKLLDKKETVESAISKANPSGSHNNCYNCVAAVASRLCGLDVTAKADTMGGKGMSFDAVCRVFGLNPDNESDVRRIMNPTVERVTKQIAKNYSEGDVGAIGFGWNETYKRNFGVNAHTLNWIIQNGSVEFVDGQTNCGDAFLRSMLSKYMDGNSEVSVGKFGNIETGLGNVSVELLKMMVE